MQHGLQTILLTGVINQPMNSFRTAFLIFTAKALFLLSFFAAKGIQSHLVSSGGSNIDWSYDHPHDHDHEEIGHRHHQHQHHIYHDVELKQRSLTNSDRSLSSSASDEALKFIRCSQPDPTIEEAKTDADLVRKWISYKKRVGKDKLIQDPVVIQTYFHIITNGLIGDHSDKQISDQIAVLNKSFEGTGFQFILADITRTDNAIWFSNSGVNNDVDIEMKSALRTGDASVLNIFVTEPGRNTLGWATFPSWYTDNPSLDGVVIKGESMPGGSVESFNLGGTAVHEVGHWMGLFHTFQGDLGGFRLGRGCRGDGDFVDDTPAQRGPTIGCPKRRNSCRFSAGDDPINNYMDYSHDICLTEFTANQITKMQALWAAYRDGGVSSTTCSSFTEEYECQSKACEWDGATCSSPIFG